MSSLERVVERLVQVRTVECPRCKLEGKTVRVTVKKRKDKYCKTARCPAGHRINVPFSKEYVEERVVYERVNAFTARRYLSKFNGLPIPAIKGGR